MRDSNSRGLAPNTLSKCAPQRSWQPCPSVTWDDRDRWVSADAREFQRMRLRMRLQPKAGRPTPASSTGEILLGLTRGELARKAGDAASRRRLASGYVERRHHTE
jgi:hypothetical protein